MIKVFRQCLNRGLRIRYISASIADLLHSDVSQQFLAHLLTYCGGNLSRRSCNHFGHLFPEVAHIVSQIFAPIHPHFASGCRGSTLTTFI